MKWLGQGTNMCLIEPRDFSKSCWDMKTLWILHFCFQPTSMYWHGDTCWMIVWKIRIEGSKKDLRQWFSCDSFLWTKIWFFLDKSLNSWICTVNLEFLLSPPHPPIKHCYEKMNSKRTQHCDADVTVTPPTVSWKCFDG